MMSRRTLLLPAGLALAAPRIARAAAPARLDERTLDSMRGLVRDFMTAHGVPGMSVAMGKAGRLAYSEAFGWADTARREQMTPSHLMRVASVSKPVTGVALFTLVDAGKVALGHRVFGPDGVLGTRYGAPPYLPYVSDITVEHLLTHTAGGWPNMVADPMFQPVGISQDGLIAWCLANARLVQPGSGYAYSNFGYCVLGRVIERVSGRPYADYVREAVLAPAGVTRMRIGGSTLAERLPGEAVYYDAEGGNPYGMNVPRMDAHGGWIATPGDLVRFAMHAMGDRRPALLKPASLAAMSTGSGANGGYAKGWSLTMGNRWHNGSLPGTAAILVRTRGGECWAGICNMRRNGTGLGNALDALMWAMAARINWWPTEDLFGAS